MVVGTFHQPKLEMRKNNNWNTKQAKNHLFDLYYQHLEKFYISAGDLKRGIDYCEKYNIDISQDVFKLIIKISLCWEDDDIEEYIKEVKLAAFQ